MRTLPHSSECGEFFCTSVHFVPTGDYGAKRLRKCERKPHNFSRKLLLFPEKLVDFSPQLVHSSPHSLAICPFPTSTTRQSPPFGRKIREKSPNRASISTIHDFSPSKIVFFLTSHPISSDYSAHTSLPKDCHLCQIATFLSHCDRKATGNAGLLTNIFYLCYLKCADLSSFFRPICRKPRCDSPRNDRLQTHYLYARTRAKELCLPFPLRKICFTLCQ